MAQKRKLHNKSYEYVLQEEQAAAAEPVDPPAPKKAHVVTCTDPECEGCKARKEQAVRDGDMSELEAASVVVKYSKKSVDRINRLLASGDVSAVS